jgi:hypothetical protein
MQFSSKPLVPLDVAVKLSTPEFLVRCRSLRSLTSFVPMPEAPIHKDDLAMSRQHNVGISRQIPPMDAKPISHSMDHGPNDHLRAAVAPLDAAHYPASFFLRE